MFLLLLSGGEHNGGDNNKTLILVCVCVCLCFSSANKCLLKVGHYSAQLEQYPKAIEIYEQVTDEEHTCTPFNRYNS